MFPVFFFKFSDFNLAKKAKTFQGHIYGIMISSLFGDIIVWYL